MKFDDTEIEFTFEYISPKIFWEERQERFLAIKQSNNFHDSLDYTERTTVIKLVKRALALSMENVEEWLPDSFVFDDNNNIIGVQIKLISTDLNRAAADQLKVTKQRVEGLVKEAAADIIDVLSKEDE